MIISSLDCGALSIPFKHAFTHASASRAATQSLLVRAQSADGSVGFGEGCPREYVTGESVRTATRFVAAHRCEWVAALHDIQVIADWNFAHRLQVDMNPAAWAAVELALIDLCGRVEGQSAEALLGLAPLHGNFCYTAVLGDMPLREFELQLAQYQSMGFHEFKIKLSGDFLRDVDKLRVLTRAGVSPRAVRADANNLWSDWKSALHHLAALYYPFFAVEEPLRSGDYAGMRRLALALDTRIVLDESLNRVDQLGCLDGSDVHWIANIRVSKMGGLLRSLEFIEAARRRGLSVIVGAHVGETSVLTRAAMTVAAQASDILLGQEGAFGTHLLSSDLVEHPIMFGRCGVLDVASSCLGSRPGFGLSIIQPVLHLGPAEA
jgi:L-alanine-DL-glutamate epimerase-like enolase superfamily enzyme